VSECSSDKSGNKRPRKNQNQKRKIGYIITTMTTTDISKNVEELESKNNDMSVISDDVSGEMCYPSFKGIFLAEEYRGMKLVDESIESYTSMSRAMMSVYYRFLLYLYKAYMKKRVGGSVGHNNSKHGIEEIGRNSRCGQAINLDNSDEAAKCTSTIPYLNMEFKTNCVMRKVLVCKLLTSQKWRPVKSSKSFDVTVLPQVLPSDQQPPESVGASTLITSPILSHQVMQSKLFTPRTCQSQNIEMVTWEDALARSNAMKSLQPQQDIEVNNTPKIRSVVTVNCAYILDVTALLVLESTARRVEGSFTFMEECHNIMIE
jgi:hypothetical protein